LDGGFCEFDISQINFKNGAKYFGSFNNPMNCGLTKGRGIEKILNHFNTSLDKLDIIIMNEGI